MKGFDTYEAARAWAQAKANAEQCSMYVQRPLGGISNQWVAGYLPRPENRYGWELRVEAVEPE